MPEVDAVRPGTDPRQHSVAEHGDRAEQGGRTSRDHGGGAHHREDGGRPGERRGGVEPHGRQDDDGEAGPTGDGANEGGHPGDRRRQQGEPGPRQQLPCPGREAVERPRLVAAGEGHARQERQRPQERHQPGDDGQGTAAVAGEELEQHRPHQVELLLQGQRPEVQQRRRRGVTREVVALAMGEHDVDHEHRRCQRVVGQVDCRQRIEDEVAGHERRHDHERRRRQQPTGAPGPEAPERDEAGAAQLTDEQRRDQEPGDDEEDVDADEAGAERPELGVVGEHENDGDGAQALDVETEGVGVGWRPGVRARGSPRCRQGGTRPESRRGQRAAAGRRERARRRQRPDRRPLHLVTVPRRRSGNADLGARDAASCEGPSGVRLVPNLGADYVLGANPPAQRCERHRGPNQHRVRRAPTGRGVPDRTVSG